MGTHQIYSSFCFIVKEEDELEQNDTEDTRLNNTLGNDTAPQNATNFDPPPIDVSKQQLQKRLKSSTNNIINLNQSQIENIENKYLADIMNITKSQQQSQSNKTTDQSKLYTSIYG